MAIGDNRLFTRPEIEYWRNDYLINGNPAANIDAYWTPDVAERLRAAVLMKLPITVDEFRYDMKIMSPYSRGVGSGQYWLHPDETIGESYLYQVVAADT